MERKIGEIFELDGEWYQCIENDSCGECSLFTTECGSGTKSDLADKVVGQCSKVRRIDSKHAIFKKLEKVGEPFERNSYLYQEYKAHTYPLLMSGDAKIPTTNGFAVIIKQNKEDMKKKRRVSADTINGINHGIEPMSSYYKKDMEENKVKISRGNADYLISKLQDILADHLHGGESDEVIAEFEKFIDTDEKHSNSGNIGKNLKPFDLEAAKAGKPVCTRDGRKARIICFDANGEYPLIALITLDNDAEDIKRYTVGGRYYGSSESNSDLMMLPEKKEGWVNVYKGSACTSVYPRIYKSKEEAISDKTAEKRIDTVKIEWED